MSDPTGYDPGASGAGSSLGDAADAYDAQYEARYNAAAGAEVPADTGDAAGADDSADSADAADDPALVGPPRPEQTPEDAALAGKVEEAMHDVIDPELGINVVDLGLVYDIWIENETEAVINMTLTSPACPLTDVLEDQTQGAVVSSGVASAVTINWVWMPPWGPHLITEDGREQLRALGFSV